MLPNERLVTGRRLPRLDGGAKASGRHVYGADFALPGMLYGKILRSQVPRARLLRIDTSRAAALPGVRAVITAADIPKVRYGNAVKDLTVFATDQVRFVGHVIRPRPDGGGGQLRAAEGHPGHAWDGIPGSLC